MAGLNNVYSLCGGDLEPLQVGVALFLQDESPGMRGERNCPLLKMCNCGHAKTLT